MFLRRWGKIFTPLLISYYYFSWLNRTAPKLIAHRHIEFRRSLFGRLCSIRSFPFSFWAAQWCVGTRDSHSGKLCNIMAVFGFFVFFSIADEQENGWFCITNRLKLFSFSAFYCSIEPILHLRLPFNSIPPHRPIVRLNAVFQQSFRLFDCCRDRDVQCNPKRLVASRILHWRNHKFNGNSR